jgi:hypothetical protein
VQVISGATIVVGDTTDGAGGAAPAASGNVTYDLLCRAHWMQGARAARGAQLELLDDEDGRAGDHPDRSGPVEVDPAAVPTPLHATKTAGDPT